MKERVNITLEYSTLKRAKEYISNLSKFINKTLDNYIKYKDKKNHVMSEEELAEMKEKIEIANFNIWAAIENESN